MKRIALAAFAILTMLALPAVSAGATKDSPVLARIVKSGKLRVGMSGSQPPLNFKSKGGVLMGFEKDLAGGLAELMQVELEVVQKPFGELLETLRKGEVDIVMSGMTITTERNMKVAFVGPYMLSGKSFLTRQSSAIATAKSRNDLDKPGMKYAALEGSTSQIFVEKLLPQAALVKTPNYDEAVAKLLAGDVDAMVADYEIIVLTTMRNPSAGLVAASPISIEPIGVAVGPGDPLLINFLENTFSALEASGLLTELRKRWFERSDWLEQLP
jgi:polar amino acid transport system substrate-binding protein